MKPGQMIGYHVIIDGGLLVALEGDSRWSTLALRLLGSSFNRPQTVVSLEFALGRWCRDTHRVRVSSKRRNNQPAHFDIA
jgi:hypothetical protein